MSNIGDPFSVAVPTVGSSGPQFATDINAILNDIVGRLSARVPVASLNINSNLDMAGSTLLNAGYITLTNTASSPSSSPVNRITAFNGDLYYISPTAVIQLTSGGTINATGIGGIGGDYGGANPASFRYDSANTRYDAWGNFAGNSLADVRMLGLQLAANATSAVRARFLFAGSVNQTYIFPAAPATSAERPLHMTSSGAFVVGHGNKSLTYHVLPYNASNGAGTSINNGATVQSTTAVCTVYKGLDGIPIGSRIISASMNLASKTSTNACTLRVLKTTAGGTTLATQATTATGAQTVTATLGAPEVVTSGTTYYLSVQFATNGVTSGEETLAGYQVTIDLPA